MSALKFEIFGDVFEVLGVFFLSVEAIRLNNLDKLSVRFLRPLEHMEHILQPGTFQPQESQRTPDELRADHAALRHFFLSHYGAGLATVAFVTLIALYSSSTILSFFWNLTTNWDRASIVIIVFGLALFPIVAALLATRSSSRIGPIGVMFVMVVASFPIALVPMALGELGHQGSS